VNIAKITPAAGLAYSAQQLLKTRGALAPVAPPLSYAHGVGKVHDGQVSYNCKGAISCGKTKGGGW